MKMNTIKTALAAFFTSSALAADGPLASNFVSFTAIRKNEGVNGALSRELKGQTGWGVTGNGASQTLSYQLAMIVE